MQRRVQSNNSGSPGGGEDARLKEQDAHIVWLEKALVVKQERIDKLETIHKSSVEQLVRQRVGMLSPCLRFRLCCSQRVCKKCRPAHPRTDLVRSDRARIFARVSCIPQASTSERWLIKTTAVPPTIW